MGNISVSTNYINSIIKKYDGTPRGSSSLWGARMQKAYGTLSKGMDHHLEFDPNIKFDYSVKQISIARHLRSGYYERLLNSKDVINALRSSLVVLDMEIFDSIFHDQDGVVTMPDSDNIKEAYSHCFVVLGYDRWNNRFVVNNPSWPWWGHNGLGAIPLEYLDKYLLIAFASSHLLRFNLRKRIELFKRKMIFSGNKYYTNIFLEDAFSCDNRQQLNFEITTHWGDLVGWAHFAYDKNNKKTLELLDIFVLEEYRRRGIGSFLIKEMINFTGAINFIGYIPAQDLIGDREEVVKSFLLKNDFMVFSDKSKFKDSRFRIELIR